MSESEHRRAVRAALSVEGQLRGLFASLGSAEHPNGRVLRAYRVARRALRSRGGLEPVAVAETLGELRGSMVRIASETLREAAAAGARSARAQLEGYGVTVRPAVYNIQPALLGWLGSVDSQAQAVTAAVTAGMERELITGDQEQPGLLNPSGPVREGARWAAVVAQAAWWQWVSGSVGGGTVGDRPQRGRSAPDELLKQTVAAIDERTTECCLMAHGQVVALDGEFELRGRPRYADRLAWTPFHWYCRSSVALVRRRDAADELSRQMIEAALAELQARGEKGRDRVEIHPADARSRR